MRINRFIASALGISRRAADTLIQDQVILINGSVAQLGDHVVETDTVVFNGQRLRPQTQRQTIILNKPTGYICSRKQQGTAPTIYALLPATLHHLKPVGRLDKDSSGLLLLTDDGDLHFKLTHPKFNKPKIYDVRINSPLTAHDREAIQKGLQLDDGISILQLQPLGNVCDCRVTLHEVRNRQIRRTFAVVGYTVTKLHRIAFGDYTLPDIQFGKYIKIL